MAVTQEARPPFAGLQRALGPYSIVALCRHLLGSTAPNLMGTLLPDSAATAKPAVLGVRWRFHQGKGLRRDSEGPGQWGGGTVTS